MLILGLSTVNKTIHNGLFHPNPTHVDSFPAGCSGSHEGECGKSGSSSHKNDCDASCPVKIYSSGILSLDYFPNYFNTPFSKSDNNEYNIYSFISVDEERGYPVRGPPIVKA